MKRVFLLLFFLNTIASVQPVEVKIDSIADMPYSDVGRMFFFHDILFYKGSKSFLFISDGKLGIPINEIYNHEKAGAYGYVSDLKLTPDSKRLFYYIKNGIGYDNEPFFIAYEILIDTGGCIYYNSINKELFDSINWERTTYIDTENKYPLQDNTELVFTNRFDEKIHKKTYGLVINKNNHSAFDFSFLDKEFPICSFTLNKRMTKLAALYVNPDNYTSWSPKNEKNKIIIYSLIYKGIINDNRVRIRSDANLSSTILGYLNSGDLISITDRSDSQSDDWYRVETENGLNGWVYGSYITFLEVK